MKAKDLFYGQRYKIKGKIITIDADGQYITISSDGSIIDTIHCYIKTEEDRNQIRKYSVGDEINLKLKIIEVDELFGFYADIYGVYNKE